MEFLGKVNLLSGRWIYWFKEVICVSFLSNLHLQGFPCRLPLSQNATNSRRWQQNFKSGEFEWRQLISDVRCQIGWKKSCSYVKYTVVFNHLLCDANIPLRRPKLTLPNCHFPPSATSQREIHTSVQTYHCLPINALLIARFKEFGFV